MFVRKTLILKQVFAQSDLGHQKCISFILWRMELEQVCLEPSN